MTTIDSVIRDLMNYFAAVGPAPDRTFTIRDFHWSVMMNTYAPEDRDCLGLALDRLIETGIMTPASATGYRLTPKGLDEVRATRRARTLKLET